MRETVNKTIKYIFYLITGIQVLFALIWIGNNFFHVYMWPETAEYLDIVKNYVLDEYVGIIYPFLVKYLYFIPLYVVQLLLASVSTYLFLWNGIKLEQNNAMWGTAYIVTFPMLLQFHLAIRPESIRLSAVMLCVTFFTYKKRNWKRYLALACLVIVLFGITRSQQTTGARGRIQRSFWAAAFQRTCTEYYSQSFVAWDDRTLSTYTIWEALEIIKRSDNMMYEIGPTMDKKWGLDAANESYKEMTLTCVRIRTRDVVENIVNDLEDSIKLPFSILQQQDGTRRSQTGRNYEAFVSQSSKINHIYWNFGIWAMLALLFAGMVRYITDSMAGKHVVKILNFSWELLVAVILQWIYKTMTTGDALDYSRYLLIIAGWGILSTHLICNDGESVIK